MCSEEGREAGKTSHQGLCSCLPRPLQRTAPLPHPGDHGHRPPGAVPVLDFSPITTCLHVYVGGNPSWKVSSQVSHSDSSMLHYPARK